MSILIIFDRNFAINKCTKFGNVRIDVITDNIDIK